MSDAKISELALATSFSATDVLPAVISGQTVKINIGTILSQIALGGKVVLGGATVTHDVATVDLSSFMSHVTGSLILSTGVAWQLKFITADGVSSISPTLANFTSLAFTTGQTALLLYVDKWYVISANCTVT